MAKTEEKPVKGKPSAAAATPTPTAKGGKKSKGAYPDLGTKVPKGATPATMHLVGEEVSVKIVVKDGDREGEHIDVNLTYIDAHGVRFMRDWRGRNVDGCMPMANILRIERRLDKGKGDNFDEIGWGGSKAPAWAEGHVGQWATVMTTDGGRTVEMGAGFIGAVDDAGVGFAYSKHGYERIVFIPLANLVSLSIKLEADGAGDDEE